MFRNANPWNLKGSLFEGNKDHLFNQARSDLARKQNSKDWRYRTHNTDLLNLDENKLDYKKNLNCL